MSKAVVPIPCVILEDDVTRLSRPTSWGVPQGGIVYNYQQIKATGSTWGASGTAVNFTANPPSPEIIVDRRVMCQVQFYLTFQATPQLGVPVLQLGTNDGPRAFPLMQAINTINATINNNTITSLMDPIIALMRYNLAYNLMQNEYSQTPCTMDFYQEYDYWNGIPLAATSGVTATPSSNGANPINVAIQGGSARNPLNAVGENAYLPSRGGFLMSVISNPVGDGITPMNAAVILTVTEPLFMTPFTQWGEEPGFYGIQTLNISFTLNSSWYNRVWSSNFAKVGAPAYVTNVNTIISPQALSVNAYNPTVTIAGNIPNAPTLLFRYITPSPIKTLPPLMEYPYTSILTFTTAAPALANSIYSGLAGPSDITSNAVQFNTIPDQIFVYLMRQPQDRNHLTSDTFAGITRVQIQFMNQSGLLASATPYDLWRMSSRNGYIGSFDSWRLLSGSVLCIRPGLDLGLEPSLAPGMNGLYNFQITVSWFNPSAQPVNYLLYVVALTSGLVTIKDNGTVTQTGIITRSDVLSAQQAPSMGYTQAKALIGGDFFGNLKNIASRGLDFVSNIGRPAAEILSWIPHPGAQAASGAINAGLGVLNHGRRFTGLGLRGRGFGDSGQVGGVVDPEGEGLGLMPSNGVDYEGLSSLYPEEGDYHQPERRREREEAAPEPQFLSRRRTNPALDPRSATTPQFR